MTNKITNLFLSLFIISISILPAFSAYTPPQQVQSLNDVSYMFAYLFSGSLIPGLIGLALVFFLIGVVKFVASGDNEEKRTSGRNMMIFGIIVLFVMVSVWGLVSIIYKSFFSDTQTLPNYFPSEI